MDSKNKTLNSHKEIISKLNFQKFKKEIITEINRARSDPNSYQAKLEQIFSTAQQTKSESNSILTINGIKLKLVEGLSVIESAIEFLRTQKKVQKLKILPAMDSAASELLTHLTEKEGLIDSEQILYKDIYDPETRLNKHGKCFGAVDEIIDCGCFDAELLVISLIIGDGDEDRLERNTLFLEEFKFVGIATNILPKSERICSVINICEEFVSPGEFVPKSSRKVKFLGDEDDNTTDNSNNDDDDKKFNYDDYQSKSTISNKLYLSKKFYEQTETLSNEKNHKNKNEEKIQNKNNNDGEYCSETQSTEYSTKKEEENADKSFNSKFKNRNINLKAGNRNKRKSSLLNYKAKKNSIDKFISFFNNQEKYLDTILEKMGKDLMQEEILYSSGDEDDKNDDCYEYYELVEEKTIKKVTGRRNKNSIVSFNEIEELDKEKNEMNLPEGVYKITWDEKKFTDPIDKRGYFIVEKNTYKDNGEIIRVVYTKY